MVADGGVREQGSAGCNEGIPQGLKPHLLAMVNVWAEAQTYLEAKTLSG